MDLNKEKNAIAARIEAVRRRKPSLVRKVEQHVEALDSASVPPGVLADEPPRRKGPGGPRSSEKATPVAPRGQKSLPRPSLADFLALDDGAAPAQTVEDLAAMVGTSPSSLRQLEPQLLRRPDGTFPLAPNRALLQALGYIAGVDDGLTPKERMDLRKSRAVCERLEFEFEVYRGRFLERSDVDRQVAEAASLLRQELLTVKRLAIDWAGLGPAELAASFEQAVERSLTLFIARAKPGAVVMKDDAAAPEDAPDDGE